MQTEAAAVSSGSPERHCCFHCAEPVPRNKPLFARIDGADQPVCCSGCKAVAEFISTAGLSGFYAVRDTPSMTAPDKDARRQSWESYDNESVQQRILSRCSDSQHEAVFLVEGIRCAACTWLIERAVGGMEGVTRCEANPATSKAVISWDPGRVRLSNILRQVSRLGFTPHPVFGDDRSESSQREQRAALRRLLVAGVGMMQVLMFAVALYAGAFEGIDARARDFLRLVSLIVATPVVIYSGYPFFRAAIRDIRHARPGMDVPVAIAIGSAYLASLWVTLTGGPDVYFDSATMFVFLLLAARYMEMKARHRSAETADALQSLIPQLATVIGDNREREVPIAELTAGDRLLIRPGAIVPADGRICWGASTIDESMITGEFEPRPVRIGNPVIAGSQNLEQALQVEVEKTGEQTAVAAIRRMIEGAQARKPSLSRLADAVSRWFVAGMLLLTTLVGLYWYFSDPSRAFAIALSLLVVTCPCALALATPAAFTAAMDSLARRGIVVTNSDAIEALAGTRTLLLDKTGTLTAGRYQVLETRPAEPYSRDDAVKLAARLEQASEHPVARAFAPWFDGEFCEDFIAFPGEGVEGTIDALRYRLGSVEFAGRLADFPDEDHACETRSAGVLTLALVNDAGLVAFFDLGDRLREDATRAMRQLSDLGFELEIASGASPRVVEAIAKETGIRKFNSALRPGDKLQLLEQRRATRGRVAMVGDGINDAPVLAAADISLAMGGGTALAQASADVVILGDRLTAIPDAVVTSQNTLRIVRQNLAWAIAYNLLAIPIAAAGLIQPWMAAIGMSLSSLIVVANSMRLARVPSRRETRNEQRAMLK